jgi:tetratricopeptide (TPR) repeat protein
MKFSPKFWLSLAVFQLVFGIVVFAITREYYLPETEDTPHPPIPTAQSEPAWPTSITASEIERLTSPVSGETEIQDPIALSRQADEFFANRQYGEAVQSYERLLNFRPNDADVYNNLGLTLHYVGRSTEALRRLNEGIAIDPQYQRIWLTLGFVNSQLGNIEQARTALTTATQIGTDESIRQSATKMLEDLP